MTSEEIIARKDQDIKNKDLSIECLKGIIKKKEKSIAVCVGELEKMHREIERLKSRPFWRFWK